MKTILLAAAAACALVAPAYAAPTFRIDSLTASNALIREVNTVTGDDRGGMAVSATRVFLNGDNGLGSLAHDLSGGANVASTPRDGIFMNVRDQSVWTLATSATTPYTTNFNNVNGTTAITHVVQMDGVTGALTGNAIALSSTLTVNNYFNTAGMFSGYDRLLIRNTNSGAVTKIDLTTGQLTGMGNVAGINPTTSENWATWGVAEIFNGAEYLTYRQAGSQNIVRTRVADGVTSTVASFSNLSDLASFAVSPTDGRWYFHYEGAGQFGGGDETLGYATATYTIAADQTGAVPEPATWAMMMLGFGGMGYAMRRKKVSTRIRFA